MKHKQQKAIKPDILTITIHKINVNSGYNSKHIV